MLQGGPFSDVLFDVLRVVPLASLLTVLAKELFVRGAFWCIQFLATTLGSQLHFMSPGCNWKVRTHNGFHQLYVHGLIFPSWSCVSSFFVLLRELPRSWWESSGGWSGWTLIIRVFLLLWFGGMCGVFWLCLVLFFFFLLTDFSQIRECSAWAGEEAGMLQPGLDLSSCCGAAPLAISSSFLKASRKMWWMQGSQSSHLAHHLHPFAGVNSSYLRGYVGRKGAVSARGDRLVPQHFSSAGVFSSNSVTDETGTCQTLTLWTSGLEKLARLIWVLLWDGCCNLRTTLLSEKR